MNVFDPCNENSVRSHLLSRALVILLPLIVSAHLVALWKGGMTSVEMRLAVYEVVQHFQGMLALTLLWGVWPTITMASRSRLIQIGGIIIILLSWAGHEFWLDWQHEWQPRQYISDLLAILVGLLLSRWILRPAPLTNWAELLKDASHIRRHRYKRWGARLENLWKWISRMWR